MRDLVIIFLRAVGFRHPEEWSNGHLAAALEEIAGIVKPVDSQRVIIPVGTRVLVTDNTKATPWTGRVTQTLSPYVVEVTDTQGEAWDVFAKDCKVLD